MAAALAACSTEPKVNELKNTSDPQVELDLVDSNIKQAVNHQVDVLSPKNFEAAKHARDLAVEGRARNKDQKYVLHKIALSQAYLDKANDITDVSNQILKGPIEARHDALMAKSEKYFPNETKSADKDFKKLTAQVENNDTSGAEVNRGALETEYRKIEINSIKRDKLGYAQANSRSD